MFWKFLLHIDLKIFKLTPKLLSVFLPWLVLQLQQMKFALNGLNTVDSIEFGKSFSFSKHLDLGAYLCINEFWNEILQMLNYSNCFDIFGGTFTFSYHATFPQNFPICMTWTSLVRFLWFEVRWGSNCLNIDRSSTLYNVQGWKYQVCKK